ncbi:hypothetical protein ACIQC5_18830 [Paenarthrobacter sp. NPDC092416]|uniref:hypothetical protein n=1 Tax=Paenarthrobacter sp. NPDC092416 TaxID=3364386 RepID=UPI0038162805
MFRTDFPDSFSVQPEPGSVLWRYMDFSRFLSLLEYEALHFAQADLMSDKWEGASGTFNELMRSSTYSGDALDIVLAVQDKRKDFAKQIYMSCWHENKYESAAMWEIYQREGCGVAVCTPGLI